MDVMVVALVFSTPELRFSEENHKNFDIKERLVDKKCLSSIFLIYLYARQTWFTAHGFQNGNLPICKQRIEVV